MTRLPLLSFPRLNPLAFPLRVHPLAAPELPSVGGCSISGFFCPFSGFAVFLATHARYATAIGQVLCFVGNSSRYGRAQRPALKGEKMTTGHSGGARLYPRDQPQRVGLSDHSIGIPRRLSFRHVAATGLGGAVAPRAETSLRGRNRVKARLWGRSAAKAQNRRPQRTTDSGQRTKIKPIQGNSN